MLDRNAIIQEREEFLKSRQEYGDIENSMEFLDHVESVKYLMITCIIFIIAAMIILIVL